MIFVLKIYSLQLHKIMSTDGMLRSDCQLVNERTGQPQYYIFIYFQFS